MFGFVVLILFFSAADLSVVQDFPVVVGALLEFLDKALDIAIPGKEEQKNIVALTIRMLKAAKAVSHCLNAETQQKVVSGIKTLVAKALMVLNTIQDCLDESEEGGEVKRATHRDYKRSLDELGDAVQEIVEGMKQK